MPRTVPRGGSRGVRRPCRNRDVPVPGSLRPDGVPSAPGPGSPPRPGSGRDWPTVRGPIRPHAPPRRGGVGHNRPGVGGPIVLLRRLGHDDGPQGRRERTHWTFRRGPIASRAARSGRCRPPGRPGTCPLDLRERTNRAPRETEPPQSPGPHPPDQDSGERSSAGWATVTSEPISLNPAAIWMAQPLFATATTGAPVAAMASAFCLRSCADISGWRTL